MVAWTNVELEESEGTGAWWSQKVWAISFCKARLDKSCK